MAKLAIKSGNPKITFIHSLRPFGNTDDSSAAIGSVIFIAASCRDTFFGWTFGGFAKLSATVSVFGEINICAGTMGFGELGFATAGSGKGLGSLGAFATGIAGRTGSAERIGLTGGTGSAGRTGLAGFETFGGSTLWTQALATAIGGCCFTGTDGGLRGTAGWLAGALTLIAGENLGSSSGLWTSNF